MDAPQALLIQDISEYLHTIRKPLRVVIESAGLAPSIPSEEEAFVWLISNHLERVHLLEVKGHGSRLRFWEMLEGNVNAAMNGELELTTSFWIRAPRVYGTNNQVAVQVRGFDLFIWYYRDEIRHGSNRDTDPRYGGACQHHRDALGRSRN